MFILKIIVCKTKLTTKEHEHVVAVDHPHGVKVGQDVGTRDPSLTEERLDRDICFKTSAWALGKFDQKEQ